MILRIALLVMAALAIPACDTETITYVTTTCASDRIVNPSFETMTVLPIRPKGWSLPPEATRSNVATGKMPTDGSWYLKMSLDTVTDPTTILIIARQHGVDLSLLSKLTFDFEVDLKFLPASTTWSGAIYFLDGTTGLYTQLWRIVDLWSFDRINYTYARFSETVQIPILPRRGTLIITSQASDTAVGAVVDFNVDNLEVR